MFCSVQASELYVTYRGMAEDMEDNAGAAAVAACLSSECPPALIQPGAGTSGAQTLIVPFWSSSCIAQTRRIYREYQVQRRKICQIFQRNPSHYHRRSGSARSSVFLIPSRISVQTTRDWILPKRQRLYQGGMCLCVALKMGGCLPVGQVGQQGKPWSGQQGHERLQR